MIQYRQIKTKEDLDKAIELCKLHAIKFPYPVEILFGAFDGDNLVGLSGLKKIYQLEPIINTTGHGHVTTVLAEKIFAIAGTVTDKVKGFLKDKELIAQYKRYGLKIIEEGLFHVEKNV